MDRKLSLIFLKTSKDLHGSKTIIYLWRLFIGAPTTLAGLLKCWRHDSVSRWVVLIGKLSIFMLKTWSCTLVSYPHRMINNLYFEDPILYSGELSSSGNRKLIYCRPDFVFWWVVPFGGESWFIVYLCWMAVGGYLIMIYNTRSYILVDCSCWGLNVVMPLVLNWETLSYNLVGYPHRGIRIHSCIWSKP